MGGIKSALHDVIVSIVQLDSVYMEVRGVVISHLNYWLSTEDTVALYAGLKDIVPAEKLTEFTNLAQTLIKMQAAVSKMTVGAKKTEEVVAAPVVQKSNSAGWFLIMASFLVLGAIYAKSVYERYQEKGEVQWLPEPFKQVKRATRVYSRRQEGYERLL